MHVKRIVVVGEDHSGVYLGEEQPQPVSEGPYNCNLSFEPSLSDLKPFDEPIMAGCALNCDLPECSAISINGIGRVVSVLISGLHC